MFLPQLRETAPVTGDIDVKDKLKLEYVQLLMLIPVQVWVTVGEIVMSDGSVMDTMLKGMVDTKFRLRVEELNTV